MKTLHQSPLEDSFVQNPYALYDKVLADRSVQHWADYDMAAVFDAKTINSLLRDRRFGRAMPADQITPRPEHLSDFYKIEHHSMLDLEPPHHTRLRGLVLRAFTSRRIKHLEPDIRAVCQDLLATISDHPFDAISKYCTPLPVRIIARLLGVPEEMAPDLLRWSNAMVAMYQASRTIDTEIRANAAAGAFYSFLEGYIDVRRSSPADDLISHLIQAGDADDKLSKDEMIGTCVLLLNAGHEATVHTLGNGIKALLTLSEPCCAVQQSMIANTVEEILRFDPPLHMFTRYAYEDVDIGPTTILKGQQVALVLGAAGRDPTTTSAAHLFDPFRLSPQHAAFGGGLHFCVGAPLARLEMQLGLTCLFEKMPDLQLAATPQYSNTYHFHGLESLWLHP